MTNENEDIEKITDEKETMSEEKYSRNKGQWERWTGTRRTCQQRLVGDAHVNRDRQGTHESEERDTNDKYQGKQILEKISEVIHRGDKEQALKMVELVDANEVGKRTSRGRE